MDALYPLFLTIHLICAIIFVGFLFCDIVLLTPVRKVLGDEFADKMWRVILGRGEKIMPLCVLMLAITGGAMMTRWVSPNLGFFTTNMQTLLTIKILLALVIVAMVVTSITLHRLGRKNPLANVIHPIALVLGFIIAILAKIAFYI